MKQQAYGLQAQGKATAQAYVEDYGVYEEWKADDAPLFKHLYFLGLSMFIVTLLCYTFLTFFHGGVIYFGSLAIAAYCMHSIVFHRGSHKRLHNSTTVLVGLFWGALFGRICFDNFTYHMFMYSNARTYYDVVPTMSADSVADSGRLLFAKESRVDTAAAVGYAADDGHKYCVAPIRDLTDTNRVEYWAIGTDCCDWLGGFVCGDAARVGSRGGAVVFNHTGLFGSTIRMDHYEAATRKAAATFDLVAAERPLYLYWVDNATLEGLSSTYKFEAWIFVCLAIFGFAGLFFAALKPRYRRQVTT